MFDKGKYDQEYNRKNVTRKFIPFNKTVKDDAEMLDWLATKDNVTRYIKGLIYDDMSRNRCQNGSQDE